MSDVEAEIEQLAEKKKKGLGKQGSWLLRHKKMADNNPAEGAPRKLAPRPPSMMHPDDLIGGIHPTAKIADSTKRGVVGNMRRKAHKQIAKKHACERACVCALAVSLLWMSSLVVAQEVVQFFIPTPTLNAMINTNLDFLDTAEEQRAAHEDCAAGGIVNCRAFYDDQQQRELDRVVAVQTALNDYLRANLDELILCSEAFSNATEVINFIQGASGSSLADSPQTYFNGAIPGCTQQNLDRFVDNQVKSALVLAELEAYKNSADVAVNDLSNTLNSRAAYDEAYFGEKEDRLTQAGQDLLGNITGDETLILMEIEMARGMACLERSKQYPLSNGTFVDCQTPGQSVISKVNDQYEEMLTNYEDFRQSALNYRNAAEVKLEEYQSLFNRVNNALTRLSAAGINFGNLFDSVDGPGFADQLSSVLGINVQLDIEEIEQAAEEQAQAFRDGLLAEGGVIDSSTQGVQDEVNDFLQPPYDPPPVDTNASNADYVSSSNAIADQVASDLSTVSTNEEGNVDLNQFVDAEGVNATEAASNLLEKADPRQWDVFAYSDDVFETFTSNINSLNDLALTLDYAYRIIRSLMLIRKYWNISAINTPPADVRNKAGVAAGMFKESQNPVQKLGAILTSPLLNILLLVLFVSLFTWTFYKAYNPIYSEYTNNCVDLCFTDVKNDLEDGAGQPLYNTQFEGTMLYRNAYVLADQYGFTDGDYIASTEIDALNVENELLCRDNAVDSLETRVNQDDRLKFYNERQADVISNVDFLRTCVDLTGIDDNNVEAYKTSISETIFDVVKTPGPLCSSLFTDLDTYLATVVAGNLGTTVTRSREFSCDAIASCPLECNGPNERLLRGSAFNAACTTEWWMHATLLGIIMTTVVFVLVNLSRTIFMRGLVKVYWRHLSSHKFSYLASCTEEGNVIYPEDVTKKGKPFKKVIVHQLRLALIKFEAEGWITLLIGAGLNLPWLIFLIVLRRSLAFDSNRFCD